MAFRPQVRAGLVVGAAAVSLALPTAASATAPGWSTPHTATSYSVNTYATGSNGQGVQLFASGSPGSRIAQMRAVKGNATTGSTVAVNAGSPGIGLDDLSVNDSGRLVAAWAIDPQNGSGVTNVAAALGSRTSLPRSATVLPTGQAVTGLDTAIDDAGNGWVAWVQGPSVVTAGATTVHVARLATGQPPTATQVASYTNLEVSDPSIGLDGKGNPVVTWGVSTVAGTGAGVIGVTRGTAAGVFAPVVEQQLDTIELLDLETFVTSNGGVLAFWSTGQSTPAGVRFAQTAASGPFGAATTVASGASGASAIGANAAGRAAILFSTPSGSGVSLRVVLRTAAGTWGSPRPLGPSGARRLSRANVAVDGSGRVVALWDDAAASSSQPTRVLAARSSSGSNPLNTYNQVAQRSGDTRCNAPFLALADSGDGFGWWSCAVSSGSPSSGGRLARLTAPSSG